MLFRSSSLGSADTGQPWTNLRGVWGINNNKATSSSPASYPLASVQAGLMTPYLKADVDTAGGAGLAFWVTDTQNWYGVFGQTNTNVSYSQTCATYSQTGPFYSCSGSIATNYSQICNNPVGPNYGSACANPVGPNYGATCTNQQGPNYYSVCIASSGPQYYSVCDLASGPFYSSICGSSTGPNYGSGCNSWSVAYDGFRGYWYSKCTGGYFAIGPYYTCLSWYSSAPSWFCASYISGGPTYSCVGGYYQGGPSYTCATYAPSGPSYYCGGSYYQTGPSYYCGGSYSQGTSYSCSGTTLGPNYGSSCASYTQTSANSAGSTSLRIIKSAANVVTTVVDQAIAQLPASIQVFFNGNQVVARAYSGAGQTSQIGSDITYTDASPAKSTVHGIILAPGGYYQGTTVDNFSANTVQ